MLQTFLHFHSGPFYGSCSSHIHLAKIVFLLCLATILTKKMHRMGRVWGLVDSAWPNKSKRLNQIHQQRPRRHLYIILGGLKGPPGPRSKHTTIIFFSILSYCNLVESHYFYVERILYYSEKIVGIS